MRATNLCLLLAPLSVWADGFNVTKNETSNVETGSGQFDWGATGLAFGYTAGSGLKFNSTSVNVGFNAGIPNQWDGSVGGSFTVTQDIARLGLGGVLGEWAFSIVLVNDRATGRAVLTVNGEIVPLK